ncbi:MAG TPA: hypothetical protein VGJ90_11160 [Methylophilaceae bacterium]
MTDLAPDQILTGIRAYEQALDLVIQGAQKTLSIFDENLSQGAYASMARAEVLRSFLANQGQLTLVLHDSTFFLNYCPRLISLMQTYHHAIQVYVTPDYMRHVKDVFVIADATSYVRRFHIEHARFKFSLDDKAAVSGLKMRFDELLASTAHSVSISALGL